MIEKMNTRLRGHFNVKHVRAGKIIGEYDFHNDITNAGLNSLLNIMFNAATQIPSWYLGLINNTGTPTLDNGDTMSSHAGWSEFTTYSEGTRPEWAPDAPSSQVITNSVAADFTFSGAGSVYGIFVTSDSAKSGTSGTLWATAPFALPLTVVNLDELHLTYSVTAARA